MKNRTAALLLAVAVLALMAGCRHRLIFATQTSIGLDISGIEVPNKVTLSHNRYEGAIVPRKTGHATHESHSVFGGLDADFKFGLPPQYRIEQVFATGSAAVLAAESQGTRESESEKAGAGSSGTKPGAGDGSSAKASGASSRDDDALFFFTASTFGLHLSLGEQQVPPNALLGYRRTEATYIPVPESDKEVRSVYADIKIASRAGPGGDGGEEFRSELGGVRMRQSFATGAAAETLARTGETKANLFKAAGLPAEAAKIRARQRLDSDLDTVLKQVNRAGRVDGALLENLARNELGGFLLDTDGWKQKFDGEPIDALRKFLIQDSTAAAQVEELARRARERSGRLEANP